MKNVFIVLTIFITLHCHAQSPEVLAKASFLKAQESYGNGDYTTAIQKLKNVKELLGNTNPRVEYLLTQCYWESGDAILAKKSMAIYFELAADSDPNYNTMLLLLDDINTLAKKLEEAMLEKKQRAEALTIKNEQLRERLSGIDPGSSAFLYRFFPGMNFTIKMIQEAKTIADVGGVTSETDMTTSFRFRFEVLETNGSLYTINATYISVSMKMKTQYFSMNYDSEVDRNPKDPGSEAMAALLDKTFQFKIDALGEILEVTGFENMIKAQKRATPSMSDYFEQSTKATLKSTCEMIFIQFANPLPTSGEWQFVTNYSAFDQVSMKNNLRIDELGETESTLILNCTIPKVNTVQEVVKGTQNNIEVEGSQTGTLTIENSSGLISKGTLNQNVNIISNVMGTSIPSTVRSIITISKE